MQEQKVGGSVKSISKKPKVYDIDADPFSLVEDPPRLKSGTILRSSDGTLVVISKNSTYSKFGAYMLGNLTNEESIAQRLHELDPTKKYQAGSCDSVSFALLESNPDIVAVDELVNENGEMWHSIARHKDGYYVDSLGKWSKQDLFDYWDSISIWEDEGGFSWNPNVNEQPEKKPTLPPEESLKSLVDYLNDLV